MSSLLTAPLFTSIRSWQQDYRENGSGRRTQNLFAPCPIRDHYSYAAEAISRFEPKPMDAEAARSLKDQVYQQGMIDYGRKTGDLLNPMWEEEIFSGKPIGFGCDEFLNSQKPRL